MPSLTQKNESSNSPVVLETTPEKNFLENRKVVLKAIEQPEKWQMIGATDGDNTRKDSYMFEKAKRSYTLPRVLSRGGSLKVILDNIVKYKTPQYDEPLTELQFFEKQLDRDLSFHKKEDNFWLTDSVARITIGKNGVTLDLSDPMDNIKYKILLANSDRIAPNWSDRKMSPRYEFALVDEKVETSTKKDKREESEKAITHYMSIKDSTEKMTNFLKVMGNPVRGEISPEFVKNQIYDMATNNTSEYLRVANDPYFNDKVLVIDAIKVGALLKEGKGIYKLPNEFEIGETLEETLRYLRDPENRPVKEKIKNQIENTIK